MYQTQKTVKVQKMIKKYSKLAINFMFSQLYTFFLWKKIYFYFFFKSEVQLVQSERDSNTNA